MKLQSLKTGYIILICLFLLAGTVQAAINCPGTLPQGTQGGAYSYTFTGSGGNGGYPWWSRTAGAFPPGLNLTAQATNSVNLSGTPTAAGTYTFTISHKEPGADPTCTVTITINPPLTLTPNSGGGRLTISPSAVQFVMYTSSTILVAGGGSGSYTWSTPTALPAGLALSSTTGNNIQITGSCTATTGNKNFTVRVTDSTGAFIQYRYRVVVIANGCDFAGGDNIAYMSFGSIDPTAGAGTIFGTETSGVQFACSSPTAVTITVAPASGWQITSGSNTMSYTLSVAPSGTYGNVLNDLFIANSTNITQGQYINAPAGTYTNTSAITVTIAWAGGSITASLPIGNVSATVMNACAVTGSPALAFGTLDAAANAGGATATVTAPSIMCTMSAPVTVSNNGGLNFTGTPRMKSGTDYINYNFSSAGSMTGAGGTTNISGSGAGYLNMGATIPAGALDNAPAGTYSDTITLTISY